MSREDIVAIASRLFSAYLLFGLVQTLPGIVSTTILVFGSTHPKKQTPFVLTAWATCMGNESTPTNKSALERTWAN
mgnify:CR=1 FL=1